MNIEEELRQQEQEALSRWKSPQMVELLEQIIVLIKKEEPWMHLLEGTPGYFYDGKDLSGAPLYHLALYKLNLRGIVFSFAKCQGIDFTNCFMQTVIFPIQISQMPTWAKLT